MASRDFSFITLRNATAYEENNLFVQPNRVYVTSTNGTAIFSDSINISSLNTSSIVVSTLSASTINTTSLNTSTLVTSTIVATSINTSTLNTSTLYSNIMGVSTLNGSTITTNTLTGSTINGSTINFRRLIGSTLSVSSICANSISTLNIRTQTISTFGHMVLLDNNLSTLILDSLGSTLYVDGQPVITEATISTVSSVFWDELGGGSIYNKNIGVAPLYYQVGVGTQTTAINGTLDVQYRGGVTAGNVLHVSTGNNSRLIYDSNGALTCEGELVADFINTNALNVSGEIEWGQPSSYVAPIEGGAVVWNTVDISTGHTEFINARGTGPGGFLFYDGLDGSATSSLTKLASLDTSGLTIYSSFIYSTITGGSCVITDTRISGDGLISITGAATQNDIAGLTIHNGDNELNFYGNLPLENYNLIVEANDSAIIFSSTINNGALVIAPHNTLNECGIRISSNCTTTVYGTLATDILTMTNGQITGVSSMVVNTINVSTISVSSINTSTHVGSTITCQQLNSNFVSTGQLSGGSINMSGSVSCNGLINSAFGYNYYGSGNFTLTGTGANEIVATFPTVVGATYSVWGCFTASAAGGPNFSASFNIDIIPNVGDPPYILYISNKGPFTTGGALDGVSLSYSGVFKATNSNATLNFVAEGIWDPADTVTLTSVLFAAVRIC